MPKELPEGITPPEEAPATAQVAAIRAEMQTFKTEWMKMMEAYEKTVAARFEAVTKGGGGKGAIAEALISAGTEIGKAFATSGGQNSEINTLTERVVGTILRRALGQLERDMARETGHAKVVHPGA